MYLTLPLPVKKKWRHTIRYVPWDSERPHLKVRLFLAFQYSSNNFVDSDWNRQRCHFQGGPLTSWSLVERPSRKCALHIFNIHYCALSSYLDLSSLPWRYLAVDFIRTWTTTYQSAIWRTMTLFFATSYLVMRNRANHTNRSQMTRWSFRYTSMSLIPQIVLHSHRQGIWPSLECQPSQWSIRRRPATRMLSTTKLLTACIDGQGITIIYINGKRRRLLTFTR